jgi:hypothetical protein
MATVNYLAVVAAALAAFFLGALWYSPALFAKQWMKAHGYTEDKLKEMQKSAMKAYAVSVVCYLVMASVLARLNVYIHPEGSTLSQGLWLGFLTWIGFAATLGLTANMFSEKPLSAYYIDAGYQLAFMLIMGAIIGAWR